MLDTFICKWMSMFRVSEKISNKVLSSFTRSRISLGICCPGDVASAPWIISIDNSLSVSFLVSLVERLVHVANLYREGCTSVGVSYAL